jgi:uncharacterized protein YecE (DUF72 family)
MKWFIGCSGFHYKPWRGVFYPEKLPLRLWFEYYNERFNTLELNTTFYNFPKEPYLKNWYDRSPKNFVFTVKASRIITHFKKFVEVKSLMDDFYYVITKGLKDKLGPVLFQLPPNIVYSEEKLQQIINAIRPGYKNVIEFRHSSWWNKNVYDALADSKITFCSISHPSLPDALVFNSSIAYVRMHGSVKLYTSKYQVKTLQKLYDSVSADKKIKEAYVYFNNDVNVAAVENAFQLQEIAHGGAGAQRSSSKLLRRL